MLIHLDTSLLIDAFSGGRRSLDRVRAVTANADVITFCTIVLFEWLRGPRTQDESEAVEAFFELDLLPSFGRAEAACAAGLYRQVKGARQRQGELGGWGFRARAGRR